MARVTDWIDTLFQLQPTSGGQAFISLVTGAAPINMRGVTLIRTIISIGIASQSIAGAYGVQAADLAIGVASQESFAAGSLPDPQTATDKPPYGWVWRTRKIVAQNGAGSPIVVVIDADIRGARKIQNGEVYLIVNNTAIVGTAFTMEVTGIVRLLTLLP